MYEYKTVKVLAANARFGEGRRKQDKLLNKMSAEGWELMDVFRTRWANKDVLTFRREVRVPVPQRTARRDINHPGYF